MKKIYSIVILSFLLLNCTSENDSEPEQNPKPTVNSISPNEAKIGDIITINGLNFSPNENYTVQFNGVNGIIKEVTTSSIKVQIPANATSGEMLFKSNESSIVIGDITIISDLKLYAYKYFGSGNSSDPKQIVEIDKANGTSQIIATLNFNTFYLKNLVFDNNNNQIIALYDNDQTEDQYILIVDPVDGTSESIALNNASENSLYQGMTIGNDGKLYAYKYFGSGNSSDLKQIVEIDKTNGTSQIIATLNFNTFYLKNLVFDNNNNQIIALYDNDQTEDQYILIVDPVDGTSESIALNNVSENSLYQGMTIGNDGKLYAYKYFGSGNSSDPKQIVEIDKTNGTSQIIATLNFNTFYLKNLVFDSGDNQIIGLYDNNQTEDQYILIVDPVDGTSKSLALNNTSENSLYQGIVNE